MSDEHKWRRKCFVICLLALFIGLMGIVLPEQFDIAFEYVVNNTDLYNNGRITGTTYTANDSAIQLFLIFHVIGTGASLVVDTNLSINGTVVEDRDYRTTAGAGIHEHFSMTAHIPKGANYSVTNSSNLETIEWREYPILTGRNGTLSIGGNQNLSQVLDVGNNANGKGIETISYIRNNSHQYINFSQSLNQIYIHSGNNTAYSEYLHQPNFYEIAFSMGGFYDFNNLYLDTNRQISSKVATGTPPFIIASTTNNTNLNADLLDGLHASEIGGAQNLSQVLNQGNQAINQSINFTNTGKWLTIGYNPSQNLMELTTSQIFYYKQAPSTYIGYMGSGFAYSAYDNRPMKFGQSAENASTIMYNTTHGTRWQGLHISPANNNLNITGFDKVNMYQEFNMTNNSITDARNVIARMIVGVNMNSSNAPFLFPNDAKSGLGADYIGQYVSEGNSPTMILTGFGNDSTFEAPAFSGIRTRGNRSSPLPLQQDDIIFGQGGRGWFGIGGDIASTGPDFNLSASKIAVHMRAAQNWNVTAQGTKWYFYTTRNDTTTLALAMTLKDDGNLTIAGLAGSGNAYTCVDSSGTLYRGNPGC